VPQFHRRRGHGGRAWRRPAAWRTFAFRLIVLAKRRLLWRVPPQADPLVRVHRLRPGAAAGRVPRCCAGSCCSIASAPTWCRAGCERSAKQARLSFWRRAPRVEIQRAGGRDVPRILALRQANAAAGVSRSVESAVVPVTRSCGPGSQNVDVGTQTAGPWSHVDPPNGRTVVDRLRRFSPACWRTRIGAPSIGRPRTRT